MIKIQNSRLSCNVWDKGWKTTEIDMWTSHYTQTVLYINWFSTNTNLSWVQLIGYHCTATEHLECSWLDHLYRLRTCFVKIETNFRSSNFDCDFELEIAVLQKIYFLQNERGWNIDSKNGPKIKIPMSYAKVMVDERHPFKF